VQHRQRIARYLLGDRQTAWDDQGMLSPAQLV
jgi:hypothetical protein